MNSTDIKLTTTELSLLAEKAERVEKQVCEDLRRLGVMDAGALSSLSSRCAIWGRSPLWEAPQWMVQECSTKVQEFLPNGPVKTTNADSAFETSAQRGVGRVVTYTIKDTTKNGIFFPAVFKIHQGALVGVGCPMSLETHVSEWEEGVAIDGDFHPASKPVMVSNWALPTVGERITV